MNTVLVGLATSTSSAGPGDARQCAVCVLLALGLALLGAALWSMWKIPLPVHLPSQRP